MFVGDRRRAARRDVNDVVKNMREWNERYHQRPHKQTKGGK